MEQTKNKEYFLNSFLHLLLRDSGGSIDKSVVLEGYFNDLYKLVLRKLAEFDCQTHVTEDDVRRLRSLLDELVKVKYMILGKEVKISEIKA